MAKMSSTISFPSKESEKNWLSSVMVLWQTDSEIEIKPCVFQLPEELKDTKMFLASRNDEYVPRGVPYGSRSIEHVQQKEIIHVPIMRLDENTEVILRNLLAYEAAVKEADRHEVEDDVGVSEVKDRMRLMCAITKTEEDVTLLKKWKIIETEMNHKDAVEIFEGLKQCMEKRRLKSTFSDTNEDSDVNTNEDSDVNPKVKAFFKQINEWVEAFFKFLKTVVPILVVLLFFFRYFCNTHNCHLQPLVGIPSFLGIDLQAEIVPPA